jgi:hypothetical protein
VVIAGATTAVGRLVAGLCVTAFGGDNVTLLVNQAGFGSSCVVVARHVILIHSTPFNRNESSNEMRLMTRQEIARHVI